MDKIFKGIQIMIAIFLGIMIVLVFANVVMRYIFNTGFAWSEEVSRICFIYLVYLGTIDAYRDNRHLGVDLLILKVKPGARKVVYLLIQLIVIAMMALLAYGSYTLTKQSLHDNWVATHYPVSLITGIGIITGLAIILIAVVNIFKLLVRKEDVMVLLAPRDTVEQESAVAGG